MKIVPEKRAQRQDVRTAISAQFWEQPVHSARSIDGQAWSLPCEPPALRLTGYSGLSRTQQLLAAQAVGVPALPSYDAASDGLVLDRVLAKVGGRRWWAALGGRVKAQRIFRRATRDERKLEAVRELESYAVCLRGRAKLGRLSLNATAEAPDASTLRAAVAERWRERRARQQGAGQQPHERRAGAPSLSDVVVAHAVLRCALPGHDLSATLGSLASYHDACGGYALRVPRTLSLDLASHDRADGLQYRVGLHQVTAPLTEGGQPGAGRLRTVLHAQGAVAVEGEAQLWRPAGAADKPAPAAEAPAGGVGAAPAAEEPHSRVADALVAAADPEEGAAAVEQARSRPEAGADAAPTAAAQQAELAAADAAAAAAPLDPSLPLDGFARPLSETPAAHRPEEAARELALAAPTPAPPRLLASVSADEILSGIQGALSVLGELQARVAGLAGDVSDGSLQRLSAQLADVAGRRPRDGSRRPRPYSPLLSRPHLSLAGAVGCLARCPLPPLRGLAPRRGGDSEGRARGALGSRAATPGASTASLASRGSLSSQLADTWAPYLRHTALRLFASAGISGQAGRFARRWLDYTAACARVDVGLAAHHVAGGLPGGGGADDEARRPDKHRAFAMEGTGTWHALSVSLAQQVFGPVRARADLRFALDPVYTPRNEGERRTLKGLLDTALSMRPALLESVWGLDCVLPGSEGAARLALWWAPRRGEAMAELRLF